MKYATLCLVLLCTATSARAQESPAMGSRVRIVAPALGRSVGLLLASSADSLLIGFRDRAGSPLSIARADVTALQVSNGADASRNAAIAAQVGFVAGAVAFTMHHFITRGPSPQFRYDRGDVGYAAGFGAIVGTLSGAVGGAVLGGNLWLPGSLPAANAATLPPPSQRAALQTRARLRLFEPDRRLRIHTRAGLQHEGRFGSIDDGQLYIAGDTTYIVDIDQITGIDERRHTTGLWLKRGALLGAAVGAGMVVAVAAAQDECDHCTHPVTYAVPLTVGGTLIGGTLGALAGSRLTAWRPQRW